MPIPAVDDTHPDSPVFHVMAAVSVGASGGIAASAAVDCQGYDHATTWVEPAGNAGVQTYLSLDEVTWFLLIQQNDTPGPNIATLGIPNVRRIHLAGARFLRVSVSNGTAAPITVSAWVALA